MTLVVQCVELHHKGHNAHLLGVLQWYNVHVKFLKIRKLILK